MRLRPDSSISPDARERVAADGGKLGAFSRGFHRVWQFISELAVPYSAESADSNKEPARFTGDSGLTIDRGALAPGTAQYRMEAEAREEAERAHRHGPAPIDPDNLTLE